MPDGSENIKISVEDFAGRIRARYPGAYDDIPDGELAERVIRKYPVYADRVDLPPPIISQPLARGLRTATPVGDRRLNTTSSPVPARLSPFPSPIARVPINRPFSAPPNSTFVGQPQPPRAAELRFTRPFDTKQQPSAPPAVEASVPTNPQPNPQPPMSQPPAFALLTTVVSRQTPTPKHTDADFTKWAREKGYPKAEISKAMYEAELKAVQPKISTRKSKNVGQRTTVQFQKSAQPGAASTEPQIINLAGDQGARIVPEVQSFQRDIPFRDKPEGMSNTEWLIQNVIPEIVSKTGLEAVDVERYLRRGIAHRKGTPLEDTPRNSFYTFTWTPKDTAIVEDAAANKYEVLKQIVGSGQQLSDRDQEQLGRELGIDAREVKDAFVGQYQYSNAFQQGQAKRQQLEQNYGDEPPTAMNLRAQIESGLIDKGVGLQRLADEQDAYQMWLQEAGYGEPEYRRTHSMELARDIKTVLSNYGSFAQLKKERDEQKLFESTKAYRYFAPGFLAGSEAADIANRNKLTTDIYFNRTKLSNEETKNAETYGKLLDATGHKNFGTGFGLGVTSDVAALGGGVLKLFTWATGNSDTRAADWLYRLSEQASVAAETANPEKINGKDNPDYSYDFGLGNTFGGIPGIVGTTVLVGGNPIIGFAAHGILTNANKPFGEVLKKGYTNAVTASVFEFAPVIEGASGQLLETIATKAGLDGTAGATQIIKKLTEKASGAATVGTITGGQVLIEGGDIDAAKKQFQLMGIVHLVMSAKGLDKLDQATLDKLENKFIRLPDDKGNPTDVLFTKEGNGIKVTDVTGKVPDGIQQAIIAPKNTVTPEQSANAPRAQERLKPLSTNEVQKPPAEHLRQANVSTPSPYSQDSLKGAFDLTDEQAAATDVLVKAMGLDTSKIAVAKGGKSTYESETFFQDPKEKSARDRYRQTVDDVLGGTVSSDGTVRVSSGSAVLQAVGLSRKPLFIPAERFAKAASEKHFVRPETMRALPELLDSPVMVFKSGSDALVAVLDAVDAKGDPVVAAIHKDRKVAQYIVNFVASVYGKSTKTAFEHWIDSGQLLYADTKKVPAWSTLHRLQLPDKVQSLQAQRSIKTETDIVNPLRQGAKGVIEFVADGKAIIRGLQNPDVSTAAHEIAHVARRQLFNRNIGAEQRAGISDADIDAVEQWARVKDGNWKQDNEERFARGFERYLRDGKAPTPKLADVFARFKDWLTNIYKKLRGSDIDIKISPEVKQVFDKWLGANSEKASQKSEIEIPFEEGISDDAKREQEYIERANANKLARESQAETKEANSGKQNRKNIRDYLMGPHIAEMKGDEVPIFPKFGQLASWVGNYFRSKYKNLVNNPQVGDIIINEQTAKNSISHGLGREKAQAFYLVPELLKNGEVLEHDPASATKPEGLFIGAPLKIGEKDFVGIALVRRDRNGNRFYVHEVALKERLSDTAFKTGGIQNERRTGAGQGAIINVLRRVFGVNDAQIRDSGTEGNPLGESTTKNQKGMGDIDGEWNSLREKGSPSELRTWLIENAQEGNTIQFPDGSRYVVKRYGDQVALSHVDPRGRTDPGDDLVIGKKSNGEEYGKVDDKLFRMSTVDGEGNRQIDSSRYIKAQSEAGPESASSSGDGKDITQPIGIGNNPGEPAPSKQVAGNDSDATTEGSPEEKPDFIYQGRPVREISREGDFVEIQYLDGEREVAAVHQNELAKPSDPTDSNLRPQMSVREVRRHSQNALDTTNELTPGEEQLPSKAYSIRADRLNGELDAAVNSQKPIRQLLKDAKLEIRKQELYLNPEAYKIMDDAIIKAFGIGPPGQWLGIYLTPDQVQRLRPVLEKYLKENNATRHDAAEFLRLFDRAVDPTHGDLVQIAAGDAAPTGLRNVREEERAHRADWRVGLRFRVARRVFLRHPIGLIAMHNLRYGSYRGQTQVQLATEVVAKLFVRGGNKELGITEAQNDELIDKYLDGLFSEGVTVEEIEREYVKIGRKGREFVANAKRRNIGRNTRFDEPPKPGGP